MKKDHALDWDSIIEDDSDGYTLLPPGEYIGRVAWYEAGCHKGSEKVPPCQKAIIHIILDTPDGPKSMTANLLLQIRMEWKLREFFRAVSENRDGEGPRMNWKTLRGAPIAVHVRVRSYTTPEGEERMVNDIDKFLAFDASRFPADPGWLENAVRQETEEED